MLSLSFPFYKILMLTCILQFDHEDSDEAFRINYIKTSNYGGRSWSIAALLSLWVRTTLANLSPKIFRLLFLNVVKLQL